MSQLAEQNAHISTAEIEQDILETEREIAQAEREAEHLERTPDSMREARWDHMRASARRSGIAERKEFIAKLKAILAERQQASSGTFIGREKDSAGLKMSQAGKRRHEL